MEKLLRLGGALDFAFECFVKSSLEMTKEPADCRAICVSGQLELTTETAAAAELFLSLLNEQAALYRQLKQLTIRQREFISVEDPSLLLRMLNDRRKLTDELLVVSERIAPMRREWNSLRATMEPTQRSLVERLFDEVHRIAGEIVASDEQDVQLLEIRRKRVGTILRQVPAGRAMLSAYGRSGKVAPTEVNQTDEQG